MDVQKRTNGNCGNCVFNVNFSSFLRRRKMMRKVSVMLVVGSVMLVMGASIGFATPAQQYVGYTNGFTPDGSGQAYWDLTGSEVVS